MSSAYGYGQFLDATWADMVREHGDKYGVERASEMSNAQANSSSMRNDTKLQAGILAEFTKANAEKGTSIGGTDSAANVYAMHNLGGSDGPKFLRAMAENPNARVDSVLSSTVIQRNASLYGDGSLSLTDAYRNMGAQMERYSSYADQVAGQAREPAQVPPHADRHANNAAALPAAAALAFNGRPLHEGMHGQDVRALQQQLNELGYVDQQGRRLRPDADFGPSTRAAVEAFQQASHLEADGIAGAVTLARLSAEMEKNTPTKSSEPTTLLDNPGHPGNGMFKQALRGMEIIDAAQGRMSDHMTTHVAGAITVEAFNRGLTRIDVVALSTDATRCWAMQGHTNDPFKQLASVDLNQAVNIPLAQSTMAWEQTRQQQQAQHVQQQDQQQSQAQQHGPTMHR